MVSEPATSAAARLRLVASTITGNMGSIRTNTESSALGISIVEQQPVTFKKLDSRIKNDFAANQEQLTTKSDEIEANDELNNHLPDFSHTPTYSFGR